MKIKFYTDGFILPFGKPYVIVSYVENDLEYSVEVLVIFETFNKPILNFKRYASRKEDFKSLEHFVKYNLETLGGTIFHEIVCKEFPNKIKEISYNYSVNLKKRKANILGIINTKYPEVLDKVYEKTINVELKNLINKYKSLQIISTDLL